MGFEKFGKVGFVSDTKIGKITDHLAKGRLVATRCSRCRRLYFPPRADCGRCLGNLMKWVRLSGEARLLATTEVHFSPPALKEDTPYVLALARLKEGPRAFGWLRTEPNGDKEARVKLHLVPVRGREGRVYYEFRSVPSRLPSSRRRGRSSRSRGS